MAQALLPLNDIEFWQNPYPRLNALREQARTAITPDGACVVLRHADVLELLSGGDFLNEGASLLERRGFVPGDCLYEYRKLALGALSGSEHLRLRSLVGRALSAQHLLMIPPIVVRHLSNLLDPLLNRPVDVLELTRRLPLEVIGEFLGIDPVDRQRVDALVREGQAKAFGVNVTPAIRTRANAIFVELEDFIGGLIGQRKLAPQSDVLTGLLQASDAGQVLSEREVVVLFLNIFIGAIESTASAMATGIRLLAEQPALLRSLHDNPSLVASFVEENLRLFPPNTVIANKIAAQATECAGHRFAAGERVVIPIGAPNRDPRVFSDPDTVDCLRKPQRHFSFSLGSHFCLGQALARSQLQAFFTHLSAKISRVELLDHVIEWEPFAAITSMKALPVQLHG